MQTRYLRTLVVAVEEGSFSRAAEVLNITQSAVSQRIKFLEEEFGQQLIDRSGTGLELTAAGQLVLTKAREILRKERELVDSLRTGLGQAKRLYLCCTPTFGTAFLPRVLNEFLRAHTDIADLKFSFMQTEEALRGLRTEDFNLAVVEHRPEQSFAGLLRYPLPDDQMLLAVKPGKLSLLADGNVDLEALTHLRLFARRDGCSSKEMLRQNLQKIGLGFGNFESVVISDDLHFTVQSLVAGEGVAFVSRSLVAEHLAAGRLTGYQVSGFQCSRGRSVALLPGREQDPLLVSLIEWIFRVVAPDQTPLAVANP